MAANFSPDNSKIVTGAADNTAIIWDARSGKLLFTLDHHTSVVWSATFSSDSKRVITGSWDGTAKIWDSDKGSLLFTLRHEGYIDQVSYSADNKIIVTAGEGIKVWDTESGSVILGLNGKIAQLSPDGEKVVTANSLGDVEIWNIKEKKLAARLNGHSSWVNSIVYSPDGTKILTASADHTAKVWNAKTGALIFSCVGHEKEVNSAFFNNDGERIITASDDYTARVWSGVNGALISQLIGHNGEVNSAIFKPIGNEIITASSDGTVRIWEGEKETFIEVVAKYASPITTTNFSSDGEKIIIYGLDVAKIWDLKESKNIINLEGRSNLAFATNFSSNGDRIIATSGKVIRIWNPQNANLIDVLAGHKDWIASVDLSARGHKLLTASDSISKIWNINGQLTGSLKGHSNRVNYAIFSPDEQKIVTASRDSTARIWNSQNYKQLASLTGHSDDVVTATFSPDGRQIITASSDKTAKIWDSESGILVRSLQHASFVNSANFSPNGEKILTACSDSTSKIWDARNGQLLASLKGHFGEVFTAAFNPDGELIVTGSNDKTAKIWDSDNGKCIHTLTGHRSGLLSARFSRDGQMILTTSVDNTTKLWDVNSGKLFYSLVYIDSTDYLVYDEHYRYDGTENARKLLYFTCGTDVIELDQVKDQLWVPNLAERIMKGEEINSPKLSELDLCDLIPTVEELEHRKDGAYEFRITPRRGGLGQAVVFVNGIEVKRLEVNQLVPSGNDYLLVLPTSEVEPYFVAGQSNKVSVRAFTKKNDIGSRGATVETVSEKKSDPPALHAVVVGVSDYKGDALDLKYAAKDARDFSNALNTAAGKLFNFDGTNRIHLYPIHTEADRKFFPDKKSIQSVFESIGKQAQPNDVLLIFFAGHGVMNTSDQQFYFLTADASAMANPEGAGISTKELFEWIQPSRIKAQKRVLILDACNSGQAINDIVKLGDANQGYTGARSDEQGKFIKAIDKLNERSGLFILSAAASDQSAYEMGRYNQGVLTYALLKSAKEDPSVLEGSQFLNLGQWFDVAQRLVEDIAASSGARQQPQVVRTTNFNIGVVDEEVRKKIVLAKEKRVFSNCIFQDEVVPVDKLNLNKLLDKELSDLASRNADNSIVFYPGSTSTEAYQLTGRYTVSGTTVTLNVFLLHRGEVMKTTQLKGDTKELTKLASEVLGWATGAVK